MPEEFEIREPRPNELRDLSLLPSSALRGSRIGDDEWPETEVSWRYQRTLAAWSSATGRPVALVAGFPFETTIPGGGTLATLGVTRVTVAATHRRRGLLRALLDRLLSDSRAGGVPIASLWASETGIYGRFGFGVATEMTSLGIDPARIRPLAETAGAATGSVRLLRPEEVLATVAPIYARSRRRAGSVDRPEWMWRRFYKQAITVDGDQWVGVHSDADGVDDGFVHYRVALDESTVTLRGEVLELWAVSPQVEVELWRYVAGIDLADRWRRHNAPVDDVLRAVARDPRGVGVEKRWDELWLRLLDVHAALTARSYGPADGAVTIAVDDDRYPGNSGAWVISPSGAERAPSGVVPDLSCPVATIGAAYLGGTSWHDLWVAGRVQVHDRAAFDHGVLARADALFSVRPLPWCGTHF